MTFQKLSEIKVLRDPIHDYIHIEYKIIWDLLNSPEFQRLRRIKQLGGTHQVYHTAEHSRFSHSLGVYEVTRLMLDRVRGLKEALNEEEQVALLCAALLHDIGHGPFSHTFESVSKVNHEIFTDRIILEKTQIHDILESTKNGLSSTVADIIAHRHHRKLLSQIISSQMDADRMDYLLRDSYFTGVSYGEFDLFRILRTIRIVNDQMVIKESGIHAVEDYIMARYQMYWQVYYHPVSRSFEVILRSLFLRMRHLYDLKWKYMDEFALFHEFLNNDQASLKSFQALDESSTLAVIMKLENSKDSILRDLSRRLLDRDLFSYINEKDVNYALLENMIKSLGFDINYYLTKDYTSQVLYKPYKEDEDSSIWVLKSNNEVVELSSASQIVEGFVRGGEKEDKKIFFPKEVKYD